jgi:uncharacterized protein with FMN-binding domain
MHLKGKQGKSMLSKIVRMLAWLSLIAAFIFGKFIRNEDNASILTNLYTNNSIQIINSQEDVLTIKSSEFPGISTVRYGKAQGYGGELLVGVQYDTVGLIEKVHVLKDRETVSFISKLNNNKFFNQFNGKKINDLFIAGNDIDAVSGCTVSSIAFANAIRNASYEAANTDFGLNIKEPVANWAFGFNEIIVLILILIAITSIYLKKKWLRYLSMLISFALVGFHLNASLSISHFARIILGFLPDIREHFIWWVLVAVSLGFPFFLKKNLYCYALCPFHAVETALIKISGFQIKLTKGFQAASKVISFSLLWLAFMLIFLSENPTLGSYEPFALLFSLDGVGLQWYLLPASLIGALLVPDFYCRYFCPVGRALKIVLNAGNKFRMLFDKKQGIDKIVKILPQPFKKAS